MFPKVEEKKCVVYDTRGERNALYKKNEIWLLVVTDTCNSHTMPGNNEPNSEIGYRKDSWEV